MQENRETSPPSGRDEQRGRRKQIRNCVNNDEESERLRYRVSSRT